MFIDPASKSTGWALFVGKKLEAHGAVEVEGAISKRLAKLHVKYRHVFAKHSPEEVHIENFRRNLAIQLHWSVGTIISAAGYQGVEAKQDCWMSSWQRYTSFKKGGPYGKLTEYIVESEDELSAIGIGLWWVNTKL